jgi:hypothetical protein
MTRLVVKMRMQLLAITHLYNSVIIFRYLHLCHTITIHIRMVIMVIICYLGIYEVLGILYYYLNLYAN